MCSLSLQKQKRHLHVKLRPFLFGFPITMQLAATVTQGPLVLRHKLSLALPLLLIVMIIIAKCEPNVKSFSLFLHPHGLNLVNFGVLHKATPALLGTFLGMLVRLFVVGAGALSEGEYPAPLREGGAEAEP